MINPVIMNKSNLRSIMAYNQAGEKRMNFYSSPTAFIDEVPTGTSRFHNISDFVASSFPFLNQLIPVHSRENNARRLTEMRFAVANIGNESLQCPRPSQTNASESVDGHGQVHEIPDVTVGQKPSSSNPAAKEQSECR